MDWHYHIPSDEEVGLGPQNSKRRALFFCACTLCKRDFDVRDGRWLETWTKKGTHFGIKVCGKCYEEEMKR